MHDAVDWKIIDENPFSKVRTQRSTVKVNEFVPREVVDKLMKKANPVWKVILGLSRYGGLRTPSETLSLRWEDIDWEMNRMSIPEPKVEHHEGRGIRSCPFANGVLTNCTNLIVFGSDTRCVWIGVFCDLGNGCFGLFPPPLPFKNSRT